MSTQGRISRIIGEFTDYINSTTDYLLASGGGVTNWERLTVTGAEINLWISFRNTYNTYHTLYINLNTRTRPIKDNMLITRDNFISFAQPVLDMISGRNTATVADFEALNIVAGPLRDTNPTRFPAPTTHPVVLSIECREPAQHTIRFKDELAGNRAKPAGVVFCEIHYIVRVADSPPDSVDDCTKSIIASRSPVTIHHLNTEVGKTAFYFLRWVNRNGEVGPWSTMYFSNIG